MVPIGSGSTSLQDRPLISAVTRHSLSIGPTGWQGPADGARLARTNRAQHGHAVDFAVPYRIEPKEISARSWSSNAVHSTATPSPSSIYRVSPENSGSQHPVALRVEPSSSNQPSHHARGASICTIGGSSADFHVKTICASFAIAFRLLSTIAE